MNTDILIKEKKITLKTKVTSDKFRKQDEKNKHEYLRKLHTRMRTSSRVNNQLGTIQTVL